MERLAVRGRALTTGALLAMLSGACGLREVVFITETLGLTWERPETSRPRSPASRTMTLDGGFAEVMIG